MRTLKFVVDGQILMLDPDCDFTDLVPGTSGYLQAEFSFSKDWDNRAKVVSFLSSMGYEYEPQVLWDGKTCMIPDAALTKRVFKLHVVGREVGGPTITTNRVEVIQNGGKT